MLRIVREAGVGFALLALSVSVAANVILYSQAKRPPVLRAGFQPAARIPHLAGTDIQGRPTSFQATRPTILYVFSPSCSWCREDYPNLLKIGSGLADRFEILGIVLWNEKAPADKRTLLQDSLKARPFPGKVVVLDPDTLDSSTLQNLRITPQTLVLDREGTILKSWVGALLGRRQQDAEAYFGLVLPGVSEASR